MRFELVWGCVLYGNNIGRSENVTASAIACYPATCTRTALASYTAESTAKGFIRKPYKP
jgi:hypothetical protein